MNAEQYVWINLVLMVISSREDLGFISEAYRI